MHMGDLLRLALEHPRAQVVGIADEDPERMEPVRAKLGIPEEAAFGDWRQCLETTKPDIVILCPATAQHGGWVEKIAPVGAHMLVEKPMAASLAEADRG